MEINNKNSNDIMDAIRQTLTKAENRVLFPDGHSVKVEICGEKVELKPLPIGWAKKLSEKLQATLRIQMVAMTPPDQIKQLDPALVESVSKDDIKKWRTSAESMMVDCLMDCVAVVAEAYELEGVDRETIENTLSVGEVKAIIMAQVEMNEEDDFLLQPLSAIVGVLSKTKEATQKLVNSASTKNIEATIVGLQESADAGESATGN